MNKEDSFLKRKASLSTVRLALLEKRLHQGSADGMSDIICQRPQQEIAPLSFAQRRLWFLQELEPECTTYNEAFVFRLQGPLHVEVFRRAIREIIRRHEVLRSTFSFAGEQVIQVTDPHAHERMLVPLIDMRTLPLEQRETAVQDYIQQELHRPWNLSQEMPCRTGLVCLDEREHISVTIMHHVATDGWSKSIFYHEIAQLYRAFCQQQPSPLPVLPFQYADYAYWQHQRLADGTLEHHLDYWRHQLVAPLPVLDVPTDHPRPAMQTYRGSRVSITIPIALTQQLHALGRQEGVTLFMTLLAAFQILLYRYTQQEDVIVGTPIAGRTHQELEVLLGCFVNTLALRTNLAGTPTFREVLQRVRKVTLEAYDHQEIPFEKLVEELQPERNASRNPLFQTMLVLQNTPLITQELPDLLLSHIETPCTTAKFDLLFNLEEQEQSLSGYIEFNTDLFEESTIHRLQGHFQRVLESMLIPEQHITAFSLLAPQECQQIAAWNDTDRAYPTTLCLHGLFEAQVQLTPLRPALTFGDETLTCEELNARANQLAHYLRRRGVGPDTLVAICLERSIEMVVGLLGILKAGGAYVPLDTGYPGERLRFMLTDARASFLLTQKHLQAELPLAGMHVLCLDADWSTVAQESTHNLSSGVSPTNLAYMIYTSGSTGLPKGAMNTHEAICNRLLWMQDAYNLTCADSVLQKTPFSFDVSVWEFFWPLITGARLVMAAPDGHRDSRYLLKVIAEQRITTLHFVPSMLQVFLEELEVSSPTYSSDVRQVICSGEALPHHLQERFFAHFSAQLHNLYGPTEAAVDVTYWECKRKGGGQIVPIGYPIANLHIYLLDPSLQLVPVGVAGELYIGGIGLARGYYRRPSLTADRFVPHPFSQQPGARLYRTGDLARYLPDGSIEYLGRNDHQVKIRGLRVELGEIEATLRTYPSLHECTVIAHSESPNNTCLIACIVAQEEQFSPRSYIAHLKTCLPDYMIPSTFVRVDALPLTPNGKLDRAALIKLKEKNTRQREDEYVAPRTLSEKQLARIWQDVLSLPRVGIHESFFEIGGHSLIVMRVLARVKDTFHVDLPVRTLFQTATIAELAEMIDLERVPGNHDGHGTRKLPPVSISRFAYRQKRSALAGSGQNLTGGIQETKGQK